MRANQAADSPFAEELLLIGSMVKGDCKTLGEAHDKLSAFYEENKAALMTMPLQNEKNEGSESDESMTKFDESKANESMYPLKRDSLSRLPEFKKVGSISQVRNAIQEGIARMSPRYNPERRLSNKSIQKNPMI